MIDGKYEYFAFISYKEEDAEWAKWLQHKLEHYKLPTTIRKEKPELPERISPIYEYKSEAGGGRLKEVLWKGLVGSKYLIVICSPRSGGDKSQWVNNGIRYFIESGLEKNIIPFIVEGKPKAEKLDEECFPSALLDLKGDRELRGININEMGRDAAAVKVVSTMFDIKFDVLWQRYEREKEEERRRLKEQNDKLLIAQSRFVAEKASKLIDDGDALLARRLALEILPKELKSLNRPYVPEAERVLRKALKRHTGVFRGHTDCVNFAVFSSDESNIISVSNDSTIKIWDSYSGNIERVLSNHSDVIHSVCLNRDKSLFATSSNDKTSIVWDANTYEVKSIIPHPSCVGFASFSPDGKKIATTAADSIVRIWDLTNLEKPYTEFVGHSNAVRVVCFSPDNRHVVTGADDYTLKVWDLDCKGQNTCIKSLVLKEFGVVRCAAYNKDGSLIIATDDTNVYLLDVNDNYKLFCPPIKPDGGVWWACFSPDEKLIATASYKDVCLWGFGKTERECKLIKSLIGHNSQITHIEFSFDGNKLLSTSSDETVRMWDISKTPNEIIYQTPVNAVAIFHASGKAVATNREVSTQLFSVDNGKIRKKERMSSQFMDESHKCFVFVDSNEDTLYKSNGVTVLQLRATDLCLKKCPVKMQSPRSYFPKEYAVIFMTISPNGRYALTAFKEGFMYLWNTENGTIIKEFDETENRNHRSICGCFHPDSNIVATVAWENPIQLWDSQTGKYLRELEMPHNYWGNSIQFNSDGNLIVSASQNCSVNLWDFETGKLIWNEMNNYKFEESVRCADFSDDTKYIIATEVNGTISIFDTISGVLLDSFYDSSSSYSYNRKVFFSKGTKEILILNDDVLKVMSFTPLEKLINNIGKQILKRNLTESEKKSYYIE